MLDTALMDALARRPPIWGAGAQDWWDFTRGGRAKRGVGAMPAETRAADDWVENEAGVLVYRSPNTRSMAGRGLRGRPTRTRLNGELALAGTANGGSATVLSVEGGWSPVRVTSLGADWHRRRVTGMSVTSGTTYAFKCRYRAGTSGKAFVALGVGGVQSTLGGNAGALSVLATTAGPVTITTQRQVNNGDYEIEGTWVPNATGSTGEIGVGPYSNSSGEYVDVIGVQLEQGAFPGPWILGGSGSAAITGPLQVLNFASKLSNGFAFVFRCNILQPASGNVRIIEFYQSNHAVNIYNAGGTLKFDVYSSGVQTTSLSLGSWAQGRNTFAAAVKNGYAMARRVGDSAPIAGSGAYSACASAGLMGVGAYDGNNTYGFSEQLAMWYGDMSAHFFDTVAWPKAQLLAQAA